MKRKTFYPTAQYLLANRQAGGSSSLFKRGIKPLAALIRAGFGLVLLLLVLVITPGCKKKETETVPVATISSISKTLLNIGDTLIIKGSGFNGAPAKNLVAVASISYTVINASAQQLTVIVPKGAQSGQLSVGFNQGQSVTFNQQITILGGTQPFISSITPGSGAYENDTVIVKGGNFTVPFNYNSIAFNGVAGTIINVTNKQIKAVVPNLSVSGPVTITTSGLTSLPFTYNITKVDPNADGHINWLNVYYQQNDHYNQVQSEAVFVKGLSNTQLPQSSVINDLKKALMPGDDINYFSNNNFYPLINGSSLDNLVVNDSQNNAYYLTATAFPFPAQYNLMKLNGTSSPVAVWRQNFPAPGTLTNFYSNPSDTIDYPPVSVKDVPVPQISMDGNTIYIKIGLTDNYYTGDVSTSSPALTLKQNVFGDPYAFKPQFGTNYIFYGEIGPSNPYDNAPDAITQIRYMPKGSKVSAVVPLTLIDGEHIINMQADRTHGDNAMIFTSGFTPDGYVYNNIYLFNAASKTVTALYNKSNWADSRPNQRYAATTGNTGFIWLGQHIYYSNSLKSTLYNSLYRLNDNGKSPKIYTVYGQLEPNGQTQATNFYFFLSK